MNAPVRIRPATTAGRRPRPRRQARFDVEPLEERRVPTVTYHGGAVLPHVEVQGIYLGSDWGNNSTYYYQTGQLEGFLKSVVGGTFLDTTTNAGYGTGRGTFNQGVIDPIAINKGYYLPDASIRADLQAYISNGSLQQPDANRLYVIYVEDNVAVSDSAGNSQKDFLGFHSSFAGTDRYGRPAAIRYAVITYPGGTIGNSSDQSLSTFDGQTAVTSHELAEAVTDPDINAWYDGNPENEIADLANLQVVYLNGYAVQRLADKNDQAMTPVGATAYRPVSFVLQTNGNVLERTSAGITTLFGGVASISDQGIDTNGRAFIDVITPGGYDYEYHDGDGSHWYYVTSGVKDAEAGQGVSFVLQTNGNLWQHTIANNQFKFIASGVASISAGTDARGVNAVDVVFTSGAAYEYSDSTGYHAIGGGVRAASAGPGGTSTVLFQNGIAQYWIEATGALSYLASNVAQVTAGTDPVGTTMFDLLYTSGVLYEYRIGSGYSDLGSGVKAVSKGRAGTIDFITTAGYSYQHSASGSIFLASSTVKTG